MHPGSKRTYRSVINDIHLLHLKHTQHLTHSEYPPLTLMEIIELNDLYCERETYEEFKHDGDKFKLDLKKLR